MNDFKSMSNGELYHRIRNNLAVFTNSLIAKEAEEMLSVLYNRIEDRKVGGVQTDEIVRTCSRGYVPKRETCIDCPVKELCGMSV